MVRAPRIGSVCRTREEERAVEVPRIEGSSDLADLLGLLSAARLDSQLLTKGTVVLGPLCRERRSESNWFDACRPCRKCMRCEGFKVWRFLRCEGFKVVRCSELWLLWLLFFSCYSLLFLLAFLFLLFLLAFLFLFFLLALPLLC